MTPLRQRMLQDMQMRNLSPHTLEAYLRAVARLAAFYKMSPDQLDIEQVRNFLVHLVGQKVSYGLFNQVRCALVFFYRVTLGRDWAFDRIACQKQPKRLPVVLSQAETRRSAWPRPSTTPAGTHPWRCFIWARPLAHSP